MLGFNKNTIIGILILLLNILSATGVSQNTDELLTELNFTQDPAKKIDIYLQLANVENSNDPYQSIDYLYQALDMVQQSEDLLSIARIHNLLGLSYERITEFDQALYHFSEALFILEKENVGDPQKTAMTLVNKANAYSYTKEYDKAMEAYNKAEEVNINDDQSIDFMINFNRANIYAYKGFNDTAITLHKSNYLKHKDIEGYCFKYPYAVASIYYMGNLYHSYSGGFDSSIVYYKRALNSCNGSISEQQKAEVYLGLAKSQSMIDQVAEGIDNALLCLEFAEKSNYTFLIGESKIVLAQNEAKRGNYELSIDYFNQYISMVQDMKTEEAKKVKKHLESKYNFIQKRELERLQIANELTLSEEQKKRQRVYIIVGVLILIIAAFIIVSLRQKQKLTKSKLNISELQKQNLETQLESKSKELTSQALRIAQYNQFKDKINGIVQEISHKPKEDVLRNLQNLKNEIRVNVSLENQQMEFERQFKGVHKDFYKKLKSSYPNLSTNDLRVCAMLKMNMSTNEISSILGITDNAVKKKRYRIKKKMELPDKTKLGEFIIQLS